MAIRITKQRASIEGFLAGREDFLTAQQVHDHLRTSGHTIGLATVYRTLQGLAEQGDLDVLRTEENEAAYRRCSATHHHHLVCRSCGFTVEVTAAPVERWARRMAEQHGFTELTHTVEVVGLCPACSRRGDLPTGPA